MGRNWFSSQEVWGKRKEGRQEPGPAPHGINGNAQTSSHGSILSYQELECSPVFRVCGGQKQRVEEEQEWGAGLCTPHCTHALEARSKVGAATSRLSGFI